jgi:hypothetical protein
VFRSCSSVGLVTLSLPLVNSVTPSMSSLFPGSSSTLYERYFSLRICFCDFLLSFDTVWEARILLLLRNVYVRILFILGFCIYALKCKLVLVSAMKSFVLPCSNFIYFLGAFEIRAVLSVVQ